MYVTILTKISFFGCQIRVLQTHTLIPVIRYPHAPHYHVMNMCTHIQVNPDKRITVERLLRHPWVMEGYKNTIDWESKFDVSISTKSTCMCVCTCVCFGCEQFCIQENNFAYNNTIFVEKEHTYIYMYVSLLNTNRNTLR